MIEVRARLWNWTFSGEDYRTFDYVAITSEGFIELDPAQGILEDIGNNFAQVPLLPAAGRMQKLFPPGDHPRLHRSAQAGGPSGTLAPHSGHPHWACTARHSGGHLLVLWLLQKETA